MYVPPTPASPGVEPWMLSAWPIPDPLDAVHSETDASLTSADAPAMRQLAEIQGPPLALGGGPYPATKPSKEWTRDAVAGTRRMLPLVCDRDQPTIVNDCAHRSTLLITAGPTMIKQEEEVRQGFEMFQVLRDRIGYLYAFDIPQAAQAAKLAVDDGQAARLREAFSLRSGDLITFEQFRHMCDLVRTGQCGPVSPVYQNEEDDEEDGGFVVPGSPGYKGSKSEPKGKDKKGKAEAKTGGGNHAKWMESRMGNAGAGVDLPDNVRRWHYTDRIEALEDNRPVKVNKKPNQPELQWSPFSGRRNSGASPWLYHDV